MPRAPGPGVPRPPRSRARGRASARVRLFALLALVCTSLVSDPVRGSSDRADPAQVVLKIASVEAPESPLGTQLQALRTHIEAATVGQVRVKLLLSGALGDEATLVERTRAGSVQAFAGSVAAIAHGAPALEVLLAPYLFESDLEVDRAFDGPVRRAVGPALERAGLRFATWGAGDFRVWFTRRGPLGRPRDATALRVTDAASSAERETYRALRMTEVTAALADTTVPAAAPNSPDVFDDTLLEGAAVTRSRAVRHVTLSRHGFAPTAIVYSERWLEGLPEQVRRELVRLPDALVRDARRNLRQMTPDLLGHLRRRGIEVHEPSRAERAACARATARVARTVAARAGADGWRVLHAVGR